MTYDPTPGHIQWLDLATRLQLGRELADLPQLADLLEHHYDDLLAHGSRNPDDPWQRYPIDPTPLDLADRRTKWAINGPEPLTLKTRRITGPGVDPAGEANLARHIGARRQGILPTLVSWVSLAAGEMHDTGQWHLPPTDPDRIVWQVDPDGIAHPTKPGPTITTETQWLRHHLDWIVQQQWSTELATEIHTIVTDLTHLGITLDGPNHHTCLTADQIADIEPVSRRTIYRWWQQGLLTDAGKIDRKRVFILHEVRALIGADRYTNIEA